MDERKCRCEVLLAFFLQMMPSKDETSVAYQTFRVLSLAIQQTWLMWLVTPHSIEANDMLTSSH